MQFTMKFGSVSIVNVVNNDDGERATAAADAAPPPRPSATKKRLLFAGDSLFAMLVIGPLVVAHWRGTWAMMDHSPVHFTPAKSMVISMLLLCTIAMLREFLFDVCTSLQRKSDPKLVAPDRCERITAYVLRKVYTLVFSFGCNMHWRAIYALLDMFFGEYYDA